MLPILKDANMINLSINALENFVATGDNREDDVINKFQIGVTVVVTSNRSSLFQSTSHLTSFNQSYCIISL